MVQISQPNEDFLNRDFVIPTVFEIMNPYLVFMDILPRVKTNSQVVRYKQETVSQSTDPKKETPRVRTASSKFAYVDITNFEQKSAILDSQGFAIRIDESAIQFEEGIDEINRAYKAIGYWLGESVNTLIATTLKANATTPTWAPYKVWSDAACTPTADLVTLAGQMRREGYPYRLTDVYVNSTNYWEMISRLTAQLTNTDIAFREITGVPSATGEERMSVPVIGGDVHGLLSGIDEGYILGLDRNNPAGTLFYNNNPKYAPQQITYSVIDPANPGSRIQKTIDNFGFSFNSYVEPESHDTVMQFWIDTVPVVKEPYAALYDSGI